MSRGAGSCQRAILAALEVSPVLILRGLLGGDFTKSQYVATYRAMRTLEAKGKIGVGYYWDVPEQKHQYVLLRPPYTMDDPMAHAGLEWSPDGYWRKPRHYDDD
jgi:hypothetical protein